MARPIISRLFRICTSGEDGDPPLLEASVSRLERFVHFWALVIRSFRRNRCPVRASALSYTTLLSLIPMLAVAMSITSLFLKNQGETQIEQFIEGFVNNLVPAADIAGTNSSASISASPVTLQTNLADITTAASFSSTASLSLTNAPDTNAPAPATGLADARHTVSKKAAGYIHSFIENTYSGTLGVTGVVFLFATAILTLTRVEETFNDIWGVTRGRDWWSRTTNYLTTIVFGPLLLVAALGLASGPHFQQTRHFVEAVPYLEPVISQVLPVVVICLTFAFFYKLVPNTKVNFTAALVGGSLAGVAWHLYNILGFLLVSRVANASKIYGGLALVPLMMGGLYIVWLTVLFGAQVAYAFQNRVSYLQEKLAENVNQRGREFIALRLMTSLGQRFQRGDSPGTVAQISGELNLPSRLVQQVLRTLLLARLVMEVQGKETGYSPARPLESITAHHILMAMRSVPGQELSENEGPARSEVLGEFARIEQAEEQAASVVTVQTLVNRVRARLELLPPSDDKNAKPL